MLDNIIPDFVSLKPHSHITSIDISMGNIYMIDLSGNMIMNVAVLNVIGFKYFWTIVIVHLIHEYSNYIVNQIN